MLPRALVLAVLILRAALAQAPAYSAGNIVNASDYTAGPFAPNSVLTIFGSNLSWYTHALNADDIVANTLPSRMAGTEVYVDNFAAPLLYVSPTQINFLIPGNEIDGNITIRVARESLSGPLVTVELADAAPALFDNGAGFAIATHADGALLTDASPAQLGETVVIYATGLGATEPNPNPGGIPQNAAPILALGSLTVSLNGVPLPWFRIKYAGVTPLSAGLYQINLELPPEVGMDPTILVTMGAHSDSGRLQLAIQ